MVLSLAGAICSFVVAWLYFTEKSEGMGWFFVTIALINTALFLSQL